MRIPIIAGNWKMHTTVEEAKALAMALLPLIDAIGGVEKVLCPPFISLAPLRDLLRGTTVGLGAQTMDYHEQGAYTGEISPLMLAPLCRYVIIGHSERRQYYCETDETVNRKVRLALAHGLAPIVCVGERLAENEAGETEAVITRQVRAAFAGVTDPADAVIAYEPVWAIGTGRAASGPQANATIGLIRRLFAEQFGAERAAALRIQYGGSVTAANIAEFMSQPEIDGALVGGASLKAAEFAAIVQTSAHIKARTGSSPS